MGEKSTVELQECRVIGGMKVEWQRKKAEEEP